MQETKRLFTPICGAEGCDPSSIYLAATVDQGGNVVNAFKNMGVPVLECTGHRLNSMVSWGVGISGSIQAGGGGTNKNRRLNALIARAIAMVGKFSHSPVN